MIELTPIEWRKVALKRILSFAFAVMGGHRIARLFSKPSVTIVAYHRIISDHHIDVRPYISVTETNLRRQIRFFKKNYEVITLEKAVELLAAGPLDRHYLVLTFDDGYEDNFTIGLKLFNEESVKPTVFVTTDCVARCNSLWPDRLRHIVYSAEISSPVTITNPLCNIGKTLPERICAVKRLITCVKGYSVLQREEFLQELAIKLRVTEQCPSLMLDTQKLKLLSEQGISIGAHTVSHPILAQVSVKESELEIRESRKALEQWAGREIVAFAYPNGTSGDFTDFTVSQLKVEGFTSAVTTQRGVNRHGCDMFRLRRTGIYLTDSLAVIKMKLAVESFLGC